MGFIRRPSGTESLARRWRSALRAFYYEISITQTRPERWDLRDSQNLWCSGRRRKLAAFNFHDASAFRPLQSPASAAGKTMLYIATIITLAAQPNEPSAQDGRAEEVAPEVCASARV